MGSGKIAGKAGRPSVKVKIILEQNAEITCSASLVANSMTAGQVFRIDAKRRGALRCFFCGIVLKFTRPMSGPGEKVMRIRTEKLSRAIMGTAAAATLALFVQTAPAANIVINEVFPGGGSSSTSVAYKTDYVEIYNTTASAIDLTGYKLQYGSSTSPAGTFAQDIFSFGAGSSIGATDYILINTGTAGTGGATNPTPNATAGVSLSATNGSVRLLDASANAVDILGYGPNNNKETTAAAAPTGLDKSIGRTSFVDSDNNSSDFSSQTPSPTAGTNSTAVAAPVPEPASLAGAAIGAALLLRRRHLT